MGRPKRKATEGKVYASVDVESEVEVESEAEATEVVVNKRQKKGGGKGKGKAATAEAGSSSLAAHEIIESKGKAVSNEADSEWESEATEVVINKRPKKGKGKGKAVAAVEAEVTEEEAEVKEVVTNKRQKKGGGKGKGKGKAVATTESEDEASEVFTKRQKKGDKEQAEGKGKGKAAAKKGSSSSVRPNADFIPPTASLGSSLMVDLFMLGDISYMPFDKLAILSKCSRVWNIRIGKIWKAKVAEGWEESMKGWLLKSGVPSDMINDWRFLNFAEQHVEHLRIDGIASGVSKTCRMCGNTNTDHISGLGFNVHSHCLKKLTDSGRAERTHRLQKLVNQELGTASKWKKDTVGASIHARMKSLPSAGGGNDVAVSIISGCKEYLAPELTFQGIKKSAEYAEAVREFEEKKIKSELRKKTTLDKRDKCQLERRTALLKWLESQKLKHYIEFCGNLGARKDEDISDDDDYGFGFGFGGGGSSAGAKSAMPVRRVHEPFTEATKDYLGHTVASKSTFEKVKAAVLTVKNKDNAQLARQKELSAWLASTPMLQHLSTLVSYPQIIYEGDGGEELSYPRPERKYWQGDWVTPDETAMKGAIGTFLDYEITVDLTFEEVQAAVLEVERKNVSQFNRQKVLQAWMEAKVAEVPDLACAQALIRWPQKKLETEQTDGDSDVELYVPQYKSELIHDEIGFMGMYGAVPTFMYPSGPNELPVHKNVQAVVDRFLRYAENVNLTLEEIGVQICEVQRCDAAQLQRMKELMAWLEGNAGIMRNYIKLIRWPQKLIEQEDVKDKGWYAPAPPRSVWEVDQNLGAWQRPKPENLGQLEEAVNTYLGHSETSAVSLEDLIASITAVEASDRKQLERQESLWAWIKGRDDLKRDFMKIIKWPWVHPRTTNPVNIDIEETRWEQNLSYHYGNYNEIEALKPTITEYLAYEAPDTATLESVTDAIVAMNLVDSAQLARNIELQTWFDEEVERNPVLRYRHRHIRWPWGKSNHLTGYTYAGPSRYPGVLYGIVEFGDFLSHNLEVTTTLDAVKNRILGRTVVTVPPAVPPAPQAEADGDVAMLDAQQLYEELFG